MRRSIILLSLIAMIAFVGCNKQKDDPIIQEEVEQTSLYFTFSLATNNGGLMTRSASDEIFNEFYEQMLSGELVADSYTLTLTNLDTNAEYEFTGEWIITT